MSRQMTHQQAQATLMEHLETISQIGFHQTIKWPRFKFDEPDRLYPLSLFDSSAPAASPENGSVSISAPDSEGKRRLVIFRSERDQGASLDTSISLTEEENRKIDDYFQLPIADRQASTNEEIQKMLITKAIGFWHHSILKLTTPNGHARYSIKAGKGHKVGSGSFSVVKDELASVELTIDNKPVFASSTQETVLRAAVEFTAQTFVEELNLYNAVSQGEAPKEKLPYPQRKKDYPVDRKSTKTRYSVQFKGISLDRYIASKNAGITGIPTPFAFRSLPADTKEEQKILFAFARGIVNEVRKIHKLGIAHRDIKLANVLLHKTTEGSYDPKLSDFGLSTDCRKPPNDLDEIPENLVGSAFQLHDVIAAPDLTYRERDIIALLKTLFMDENTTFILRAYRADLPVNMKKCVKMEKYGPPFLKATLAISHPNFNPCLFPRSFVDTRPALSALLRSVKDATKAPYGVDTTLCALLLEEYGLLSEFLTTSPSLKINIPTPLIEAVLSAFDENPHTNPLDNPGFRQWLISEYIAKPIVEATVTAAIANPSSMFHHRPDATKETPENVRNRVAPSNSP